MIFGRSADNTGRNSNQCQMNETHGVIHFVGLPCDSSGMLDLLDDVHPTWFRIGQNRSSEGLSTPEHDNVDRGPGL